MLERIASAAPLLVRHASAYGELIADDLLAAWHAFAQRLWLGVALGMAVLIALLLACTWVIASCWDTPERLQTIGVLTGIFILVALGAGIGLYVQQSRPMRLLDQTRQEWDKDRLLVEDLVAKPPVETR
jgi:uncharacterized membrane protein YqjE